LSLAVSSLLLVFISLYICVFLSLIWTMICFKIVFMFMSVKDVMTCRQERIVVRMLSLYLWMLHLNAKYALICVCDHDCIGRDADPHWQESLRSSRAAWLSQSYCGWSNALWSALVLNIQGIVLKALTRNKPFLLLWNVNIKDF
jgi:hypothetical protein